MSRPTKLTPEVQEKIVQALQAGNYQETAARYAGISEPTFYRWMADALDDNAPKELREFREAVENARAAAEVRSVALIQQAAQNGTWQAAAWFLERSHAHRWGRYQRTEVTGPNGGPVQVDIDVLDKRIAELIADTADDDDDS
jgi:transposase